ncbi:MAG: hypothetical protein E6274_01460 [Clostridium sp.]|uniref:hypothetical protein n=1 Tax=Clostridium sp. TaxID=1506 RepID=UPI0029085387|nr:hypothetical protein [Clostridium sp.]MDU7251004.1 hypothetical protein [Clostridium sp.]
MKTNKDDANFKLNFSIALTLSSLNMFNKNLKILGFLILSFLIIVAYCYIIK